MSILDQVAKRRSPDSETLTDALLRSRRMPKLQNLPSEKVYLPGRIRVPPSTIPELSEATSELIKNLRSTSISNPPNIISVIPASERFKYLLGEEKSLPLPEACLKLVRILRALDSTIYYAHNRFQSTIFDKISYAVETTHQINCKIDSIQQIIFLYPESYKLSWNCIEKDVYLFIDFYLRPIEKEHLAIRKEHFDNIVLQKVRILHESFLREMNFVWEDPMSWHPQFNFNMFPEIPKAEVPKKPIEVLPEIQKFVLKQIDDREKGQRLSAETVENFQGQEIKGLSPSIAAKILAKENYFRSQRAELVESTIVKEHNKGERLVKMVEILKVLFSTHKTPSMFLNVLLSKLSQMLCNKNKRIIEEDLNDIFNTLPEFVSLIPTNSGPVVRINRHCEIKLTDLKLELKNKYNLA